jgi:hypothetical protein
MRRRGVPRAAISISTKRNGERAWRGIFPNDAAVIRLVGAILADMHAEWQSGERRYLSEGFMAQLKPTSDADTIAAIDGGA